MTDEIILDFSTKRERTATRRRRRSKRDITRNWRVRYNAFLRDGFTDREAKWGADNGLSLRNKDVRLVRKHRRDVIAWFMSRFGWTRKRAIEEAANDLETKLEFAGVDEPNLFYEVSP